MQKIVGVERDFDKEVYYFFCDDENLKIGDYVSADFDEFKTLAKVTKILNKKDDYDNLPKAKIAKSFEIENFKKLQLKAKRQIPIIKKKSRELKLDMKFVGAQYSLDESKIMIVFSSEERIDFRQLLKELAGMLKTRIELKQIGQRDEIKICGGVGPCGEECCCARFLKDFEHVSVKMAKMQGLSLTPTKINGLCGRLKCCLGYESAQYEEILSKMPKVGSEVISPNGKGTVTYNDILRERVYVKRQTEAESFIVEDFELSQIKTNENQNHQNKNFNHFDKEHNKEHK